MNGTASDTWPDRNGVVRPTIQKALNDLAVSGGLGYEKLEELEQIPPTDGLMAEVTNDGENTGRYRGNGTQWIKSENPTAQKVAQLEVEVQNKVDGFIQNDPDILAAITDSDGLLTWLSAVKRDGGPTDHAAKLIRDRIGLQIDELSEALFTVVDANGVMSDLSVNKETGQVFEWVIKRWAERIAPYLNVDPTPSGIQSGFPQYKGTTQAIEGGDFYERNGEVLPILPDMTKMAGWGSSSMELSASAYQSLAQSFGMTYFNGGKSGQATTHISARLGSNPTLMTFSNNIILASGDSSFTTSSYGAHASQVYSGVVAGVHGTIRFEGGGKFARSTPGEAVSVPPNSLFIPDGGALYRGGVNLLWMGRNDLTGDPERVSRVIENTNKSFSFMSPLVKRCLVMGHMVGQHQEPGDVWDQILEVNAAYKKRFGNLYIDVMEYLTSAQFWTDSGITPTQADLDNQTAGKTPPSAARTEADNLHLTDLAYETIAIYLVKQQIIDLGWVEEI